MNQYPIATGEVLAIAAKEIGKSIPGLSAFIGAHESVFATIEANRVKQLFGEVIRRLSDLEKKSGKSQIIDEKSCAILLCSADQVRTDVLADAKKREYSGITAHYMTENADLNEVFEVLDCLRKLSAEDLKLLYSFRPRGSIFENRLVAELAGYNGYFDPNSDLATLRTAMEKFYPSLLRLEGLGVLFLSYNLASGGPLYPDIGGLSEHLKKFAFLTDAGKRLVNALPE